MTDVAKLVTESRGAQGLPDKVADWAALARVAAVLHGSALRARPVRWSALAGPSTSARCQVPAAPCLLAPPVNCSDRHLVLEGQNYRRLARFGGR